MSVVYNNIRDDRLPDERTAQVVRDIADSVSTMISWTADYPSSNASNRLPILDIETWCEESTTGTLTFYSFYAKPMANPIVIPANSAIPDGVKFSTYRQEAGRILRNTSLHLPWSVKANLLSSFSWRLKQSGYNPSFRAKVIGEGITGYLNTIRRNLSAGHSVNRPREIISEVRIRKKDSRGWFKRGKTEFDSVLFIPATPNSSLANILRAHEVDNNQGRLKRIKIVKSAGKSIKSVLSPNYPWRTLKCGVQECFSCSTSSIPSKISCRTPGILYKIVYDACDKVGKDASYFGESGHNAYTRGKKHLSQYAANESSHCMAIHSRVHHPDEDRSTVKYRMEILKSIRRPLDRQITEAMYISKSSADVLLNSGSEWRSNPVPRAAVARPS